MEPCPYRSVAVVVDGAKTDLVYSRNNITGFSALFSCERGGVVALDVSAAKKHYFGGSEKEDFNGG
jgi:hypothetical protein